MKRKFKILIFILCTGFTLLGIMKFNNLPFSNKKDTNVDYDLTFMNKSIAYSTLNHVKNEPQYYLGKTFKIIGQFSKYPNAPKGENRPSVLLYDEKGCCFTYMEILFNEKPYPNIGTQITLIGTLEVYYENSQKYYRIVS